MTQLISWFAFLKAATARGAHAGRASRRSSGKWWHRTALAVEFLEDRNLLSFIAPVNYDVGRAPVGVVTADFRHDGKLDLATVNLSSNNVSVLLGNGDGSFQAARTFSVGDPNTVFPSTVVVGYFNGEPGVRNRFSRHGIDS